MEHLVELRDWLMGGRDEAEYNDEWGHALHTLVRDHQTLGNTMPNFCGYCRQPMLGAHYHDEREEP